MITPELISYIEAERAKNTPEPVIRSNLRANGWDERDINEAMGSGAASPIGSAGIPRPTAATPSFFGNRNTAIVFLVLAAADFTVIMMMNGRGVFGISPFSIAVRIALIYLIALAATRKQVPGQNAWRTAGIVIMKVIAYILIAIVAGASLCYFYCLFAFN